MKEKIEIQNLSSKKNHERLAVYAAAVKAELCESKKKPESERNENADV